MARGECRKKLTILSWQVDGETARAQEAIKECQGQVSHEFCCLRFANTRLRPGPCDDGSLKHLVGLLECTVTVLRREEDKRGCFSGQWQLLADNPPQVLAAGELSGTVGCGTHRPPVTPHPCEECAAPEHYEGKLTGQILVPGDLFGAEICATLAGAGPLAPNQKQHVTIEGVVIQCCPD